MAKLTKRDGHYILRWMEHGQRKSKSLGKVGVLPQRDANAILHAKELEMSTGRKMLSGEAGDVPMFGVYAKEYLTWRAMAFPDSQDRIEQIIDHHLLPDFQFKTLDNIRAGQVEEWMRKRLREVKPETVAKELRTLKAILHHAMKRDRLQRDPLRTVQAPRSLESKPHAFYEAAQLEAIYRVSFDKAAVWKLMANTGMRRGEALALQWEQVHESYIHVLSTSADRTKSGKWRQVPISGGARAALVELGAGVERVGPVLPEIAPESLSRAFDKDSERAGIGGNLHMLRHTYISHLVRAGVPLRTVQVLAGHADYKTTEGYAHVLKGSEPAAVRELSL